MHFLAMPLRVESAGDLVQAANSTATLVPAFVEVKERRAGPLRAP